MTDSVEIRRGVYYDSVTLMQVSQRVRTAPGVSDALIGMGTELNLGLMRENGFEVPAEAGPNDLVVALRAADDEALAGAGAALEAVLQELLERSRATGGTTEVAPRTISSAARRSGAGLALISTPGTHAVADALDAISSGMSVVLFSDNISVADEIRLKDAAAARDVLVMGPDCGTAVVGGAALGFANVVRPGRVGLVAASGTGAQQVMCLLDLAGEGVSHVLGLGGRDLSAEVGGRSARQALRALAADEATEHVVIVSKPAAPEVVESLEQLAAELGVPVSWATLGRGRADLTAAVEDVLAALGTPVPTWPSWPAEGGGGGAPSGGSLRGLFCGGTLADEAMLVAEPVLGPITSNIPLAGSPRVSGTDQLTGHAVLDFGDDELTQGRAHPMIDPALRLERIREQGADPGCGVLLLDLVLGHGSHPDPSGELADAIRDARTAAAGRGVELPVVVALVGTESDPQGLTACAQTLAAAGASVHTSNAEAVRVALSHLGTPAEPTPSQTGRTDR
ncbi:acyl-CoA synthetase FdrA [Ornithinimicrobium humiphilum]|uniref:FdrA protein n=1 Tax=Ornithinimicrobium humiphilum TaxID=125288 RepID=A0A543KKZ9_9MICO|nr:FdrA family protein [Ornithinimicrobium humiphilum]TQM95765.1 FdrA protein [Ornithinimicrobium humiphilum]